MLVKMICSNCLMFEKYKQFCHYYWKNKKVCSAKIESNKETKLEKEVLK